MHTAQTVAVLYMHDCTYDIVHSAHSIILHSVSHCTIYTQYCTRSIALYNVHAELYNVHTFAGDKFAIWNVFLDSDNNFQIPAY